MIKRFFFTAFLFVGLFPAISHAQKELSEPDKLKFETAFFEALKQKAIGNYDKAIEALEICQTLDSTQVSVLFELSKNYFWLKKYFAAKQTLAKALNLDPNNVWLLEQGKNIAVAQNNYPEAIAYQNKIIALNPHKKIGLLNLYLANKDKKKALDLLSVIKKEQGLNTRLKKIQKALSNTANLKKTDPSKGLKKSLSNLKLRYKTTQDFTLLKRILALEAEQNAYQQILKDASEGLDLFPSQALLYLYAAQAGNALKNYKIALSYLDNGIDFVIDNATRKKYYLAYSKSYKGLNNTQKANYYTKLAQQL
jgi:predicted Zn-dependent protease